MVLEAAPELREIGAAVNASPQAVKALLAIGVGDQIAAVGHRSPGVYSRNLQTGEFLEFSDRFKNAQKYGAPYYSRFTALTCSTLWQAGLIAALFISDTLS